MTEQLSIGGVAYRGAELDPSGRYRFRLWRGLVPEHLCWIMLNPSTADADVDDATIRRCTRYAQSWGFKGFVVVNLFAYRATHPADLVGAHEKGLDVIGPGNDRQILDAARKAELVVVAWGQGGELGNRDLIVAAHLRAVGVRLFALGVTKSGAPVHPLRQRADLLPKAWSPEEVRF